MVTAKSDKEKDVKAKASVSKKTSVTKSAAKKTSIEKTAINKLKKEVKKSVAKVDESLSKDSTSENRGVEEVANKSTSRVAVDKNNEAKQKEQKYSFLKSSNDKQLQGESKIGEVKNGVARATGRRKRAIAKVACREKSNAKIAISVNDLDYKQFFTKLIHQDIVYAPFALLGIKTGYVVNAEVFGGGKTGQADAMKLAISRCLALLSEEYAQLLRKASFLTRDARKVEPKKAGLKKARKKEQFSKR